ncbi:Probable protein phosphatase 2C 26 [Linum grandiflorum]
MAIPVFRASIPHHSNPQFHCLIPNAWMRFRTSSSTPRKSWMLPLASSSDFNSPRSEVQFCVGTHLIPHPNKVEKGGEDAFFVSSYGGGVCAIADGVSGWAKKNVDPALFSQELMANASCFLQDEEVDCDPQVLIRKAHAATSSIGSATAIVAMLERNGTLKVANVGDCGLKLIRGGQIVFSTTPQEHYFDCPYQLSSETVGQTYLDAMVSNVEVMEGDFVVMGSDGLFDNVFDHEIVSTIARHKDVTDAAKLHSLDWSYESPYALEARSKGMEAPVWKRILGMKLTGGKLDDITVIVGRVVKAL